MHKLGWFTLRRDVLILHMNNMMICFPTQVTVYMFCTQRSQNRNRKCSGVSGVTIETVLSLSVYKCVLKLFNVYHIISCHVSESANAILWEWKLHDEITKWLENCRHILKMRLWSYLFFWHWIPLENSVKCSTLGLDIPFKRILSAT